MARYLSFEFVLLHDQTGRADTKPSKRCWLASQTISSGANNGPFDAHIYCEFFVQLVHTAAVLHLQLFLQFGDGGTPADPTTCDVSPPLTSFSMSQ